MFRGCWKELRTEKWTVSQECQMSEFTRLPKKNSKNLVCYLSYERCLPNDAERCWMQAVQMEIVSMKNPLKGEDSSPVTGSTVSRRQNLTAWIKYPGNWCLPLVIASHKSHSLPAITRNLNPCQLPWSLVAVGSTFQACRAGVNLSGPQGSNKLHMPSYATPPARVASNPPELFDLQGGIFDEDSPTWHQVILEGCPS